MTVGLHPETVAALFDGAPTPNPTAEPDVHHTPDARSLRVLMRAFADRRSILEPSTRFDGDKPVWKTLQSGVTSLRLAKETQALPPPARDFYVRHAEPPSIGPQLVLANLSAVDITRALANKESLVVTDAFNHPQLAKLGLSATMCVHSGAVDEVLPLLERVQREGIKRLIGVGGGLALDVAKAVGIDCEVVVVPTLLSTNCISTNRSVLGSGASSFSYQTATPLLTAVSIRDLAAADPVQLKRWSQSGFGDLFAEISAAMDQELRAGHLEDAAKVRAHDSDLFEALEWTAGKFDGYSLENLERLAILLHRSAYKVMENGSNEARIGGEHRIYKHLMDVKPDLRNNGATHGQIVGIATLVAVHAYGKLTGNFGFYDTVRKAFEKLGLPLTWNELTAENLTRADLVAALSRHVTENSKATVLSTFFKELDFSSLDEVFGPRTVGREAIALEPKQGPTPDLNAPVIRDTGKPWSVSFMSEARKPLEIAAVDPEILRSKLGPNVFHLPIKKPGTGYALPKEYEAAAPVIQEMIDFEHSINPNVGDLYALLTVDQGVVEPGGSQRRGGAHVDDFQWGKDPKEALDHSYVAVGGEAVDADAPAGAEPQTTEFFVQPFYLGHLVEGRDNFHRALNALIDESKIYQPKTNTVCLMDGAMVHRAPAENHRVKRTFIRLSFSPRLKQGDGSVNLALP